MSIVLKCAEAAELRPVVIVRFMNVLVGFAKFPRGPGWVVFIGFLAFYFFVGFLGAGWIFGWLRSRLCN